jgi:ABC-2 type transport system ATP-binding protein
MDEVVVAENVRRSYGDVVALDGVSLSVGAGEVFGLIGPNGAGKTTLVRALTGTARAEGRVRLLGAPPTEVDRGRIGLLPQSFSPASRLTARELIEYYGGLYEEPRDVEAVLADVGMEDDADTWYENLSGGQQRRTCVGATLVNDPDVLFLDEPTTGIDPAGRRALWDLLESLAAGGTTVFLTSHSMVEVERLADRVGLLSDGELVAVDAPGALIREYGGSDRLVVRTDGDGDAAASAVSGGGFAAESAGGDLVFRGVDPAGIGDVVALLEERGVAYESLVWTQPDLEDVYLRLTGEAFEAGRDDAAAAGVDDAHSRPGGPPDGSGASDDDAGANGARESAGSAASDESAESDGRSGRTHADVGEAADPGGER